MTTLQKTLAAVTIAAVVATPLVIQHRSQARLREQNASLREQLGQMAQLQAENERLSNLVVPPTPSPSLPDDQFRELLRLRGEVALLRQEAKRADELQKEGNRTVRSSPAGATSVKGTDLTFQGYDTPTAALQSAFVSKVKGDRQAFLASLTPAERQREEKRSSDQARILNKSQAEIEADTIAKVAEELPRMELRVEEELTEAADRINLRVRIFRRKDSDGGSWMEKTLNFQKIGNEWKLDDGL